jgi:hypothetical protein
MSAELIEPPKWPEPASARLLTTDCLTDFASLLKLAIPFAV